MSSMNFHSSIICYRHTALSQRVAGGLEPISADRKKKDRKHRKTPARIQTQDFLAVRQQNSLNQQNNFSFRVSSSLAAVLLCCTLSLSKNTKDIHEWSSMTAQRPLFIPILLSLCALFLSPATLKGPTTDRLQRKASSQYTVHLHTYTYISIDLDAFKHRFT